MKKPRPPVVHYTRVAAKAIEDIAAHTLHEWGDSQRDRYLALLEDACERLVPRYAAAARVVPGRPDLRTLRCERHVIYFRIAEDGFEIVHVLHERQLPRKHL